MCGLTDFSFSSDLDVDDCEHDDDRSDETGFCWVDNGGLYTWGLKT